MITKTFQHNNFEYIETHINPSLGELIQFSLENSSFKKFYCTLYCINDFDDVLIELDPPHFGSPDMKFRRISVNGNDIFEGDIESISKIENSRNNFVIFADEKAILTVYKDGEEWKIK